MFSSIGLTDFRVFGFGFADEEMMKSFYSCSAFERFFSRNEEMVT
jgi:hypothetical protein